MRRKLLLIITLALTIAISGCAPAGGINPTAPPPVPPEQPAQQETPPEVPTNEIPHHNASARNNLDWHGIYQGIIPSASGMGIRVQISLHADEALGGVFSLAYEHLTGDMPIPERGDWEEWSARAESQSGTFEWDETGNVIKLDVNNWPPYYFVSEQRIIQLDMSGQRITGDLADNYVLTRIMPGPTPPAPPSPPNEQPTFSAVVSPNIYSVSAEYITVEIVNTSEVEGWYGFGHRIERYVNGTWEIVPLEFFVVDLAMLLSAGYSAPYYFSLHQDQFDYQPGRYRIVLTGVPGEPWAEFTLN